VTAEDKKTCFIAMPITTHPDEVERYGGDADHWNHVMESIHVPAVKAAGFEPIRPVSRGTQMIMGDIIKHLSQADMVLCDLSGLNPNVFFELGVRTSLNLPIALVKDEHLKLPFDTSGLNTHHYDCTLRAWNTAKQISEVEQHISASAASSDGHNPMWKHFGLTIAADSPPQAASSSDAQMQLMFETMNALRSEVSMIRMDSKTPGWHGKVSTESLLAEGGALTKVADALAKELGGIRSSVGAETETVYHVDLRLKRPLDIDAEVVSRVASVVESFGFDLFGMNSKNLHVDVMMKLATR
jgi:hypothetical protein